MRLRTALLLAALVVLAAVGGPGRAATAAIEITTEEGSTVFNAPMLPSEAGIQLNGHIDGLAWSNVALDCVSCSVMVSIGGHSGAATLECDTVECTSGSWVFFPGFPIMPGDHTATATVTDADGATATDTVTVSVL